MPIWYKPRPTLKDKEGKQAVLVSAESISAIPRVYPNYFLDIRSFINEVERVLGS